MSNTQTLASTTDTISRRYEIATDGACRGNPGPGAWGAILFSKEGQTLIGSPRELFGLKRETTNNEMELTAAIKALTWLNAHNRPEHRSAPVTLFTDSEYLTKGMTEWVPRWNSNGWRSSEGKPVKNRELWEALIGAASERHITWTWVRGHAGHPENEQANALAQATLDRALQLKRVA
ncbi:ribonuclease HI [Mesorhizobium sp. CAU 1741]|uniref:ribonuclease HI n=1 Tax=Mesorhizobium sp. CAU 1741 TaxID=3140366 RepID=UPI00325BE87D